MVAPITNDERRQFYFAGTIAMAFVAAFWIAALAMGRAAWPDLLLPLALLALMVHGLVRVRHPRLSRWMQWVAMPLIAGGGIYAFVRVWGIAHHVSG